MSWLVDSTASAEQSWDPEIQLTEAMAAAAVVSAGHPAAGLYLGGATTAGLGTPMSDVDLFVVADGGETRQLLVNERRADIEFVSLAALAEDVRDFTRFRCHEDDVDQLTRASAKRLDVVVRFCLGRIVADPGGRLAELQEVLRTSTDFTRLVIARHCVDCGNLSEDLAGAIALRDWGSADFLARQLLLQAAQALLTSMGDLYIGQKWVWRRWQRTAADRVHPSLTRLLMPSDGPADPVAERLGQAMHAAQDLLVIATTGIPYEPMPVTAGPGTARRDPWRLPLPLTDGVTLSDPPGRHGVTCSDKGLLLWGLAHGRGKDEALDTFAKALPASEACPTRAEISSYYDELVSCRMIRAGDG